MTHGKIRRGLSFWVWGWPALVLFPPLGIIWLLAWSLWIIQKWREARAEFHKVPSRIVVKTPPLPAQSDWFKQQSGGFAPHLSSRGATGAFQFIDDDWARINQQAAYRARMRHAEETGDIQ